MKAILMLEDGRKFAGECPFEGERIGELVLNTAVVGYQEMLTDPANAGKILVLTYPLIGNYGVAPKFNESKRAWVAGLVIKEKTRIYSNWQAKDSFDSFINDQGVLSISEVDTRTLTVHLRQKGRMLGIISTSEAGPRELLDKITKFKKRDQASILPKVSVTKVTRVGKGKTPVTVLDLGVANSMLAQLERSGLLVTLVPYNTTAKDILKTKPKGLIVSNGPEDDSGLESVAINIKPLLGKIPMLGISTGHQVIARALGAKISRLPLGHHGVNYPICSRESFKGEITAQNHNSVVEAASLKKIKNIEISATNLNDHSVEEMESKKLKLLGVQYIPSCPGFDEVNSVFKRFSAMLRRKK